MTNLLTAADVPITDLPLATDAVAAVQPGPLTPDEVRLATHQDETGRKRSDRYALFGDYYEGRQRDPRVLTFTDDDLTRDRVFAARHNVCAPIIDILVERLTVQAFSLTTDAGDTDAASELAKLLWRWWSLNRMDAASRIVHHNALTFGDAYVMVEWDSVRGIPRYCVEDPRQITPIYDEQHRLTTVYKAWQEAESYSLSAKRRLRINRYRPGLVEKFVTDPGGYSAVPYTDDVDSDGKPDGGVIYWEAASGDPLPIPIVHFRNVPRGSDMGRSELNDAVPMQDEFNRRVWSTGQAVVFDGARIKYGLNVQPITDPQTGEAKAPPMGPNVFWYLSALDPEKVAQVATLDSGDLGSLQETADRQLKTIAGLIGIPMHLVWPEGGLPSGESLKTAEARLVAKLKDRTITYGNGWEDVCTVALAVASAFGGLTTPAGLQITTEWSPLETRSALSDEQVIALRADDLSWDQRMRERGYTEDEIEQIKTEKEAETPPALRGVDAQIGQSMRQAMAGPGNGNRSQNQVADGVAGT